MAVDLSIPVLVVDDYRTMVRIIRNLLRQLGFEDIDDASDGALALAKMRDKRYGLVISDWNMEPMTGLQLLKEIRADNKRILKKRRRSPRPWSGALSDEIGQVSNSVCRDAEAIAEVGPERDGVLLAGLLQ